MSRNAVCLCTDRNMLIPAMFVAEQAKTIAGSAAYDVLIFAEPSEVTDAQRQWIEKNDMGFIAVHGTDLTASITIANRRFSAATLFSLLVPHLLAGRYNRALYLDCDIMLGDRLAPLFELDMGRTPVAAIGAGPRRAEDADTPSRKRQVELFRALGLSEPFGYLNAGVLYVEVDRWNEADLTQRSLTFARDNPALCALPDSSGLAAVLNGDFLRLSPVWNMPTNQIGRAVRDSVDPAILHYSGPDKPWRKYATGRRLRGFEDEYQRYQDFVRDTPWVDGLKQRWTLRDVRKGISFGYRCLSRKLRGKPPPGQVAPSVLNPQTERFRRYLLEGAFADVEQGITTQAGGRLRLAR